MKGLKYKFNKKNILHQLVMEFIFGKTNIKYYFYKIYFSLKISFLI